MVKGTCEELEVTKVTVTSPENACQKELSLHFSCLNILKMFLCSLTALFLSGGLCFLKDFLELYVTWI